MFAVSESKPESLRPVRQKLVSFSSPPCIPYSSTIPAIIFFLYCTLCCCRVLLFFIIYTRVELLANFFFLHVIDTILTRLFRRFTLLDWRCLQDVSEMSPRRLRDVSIVKLIFNGLRRSSRQVRVAFALSSSNFEPADPFPTASFFLLLWVVQDPHQDPADIQHRIRRKLLPRCAGLGDGVA